MIFDVGDKAYILENHIRVSEVRIMDRRGDMYTIRFPDGGASRVRHTRLYATEEAAKKDIIPLAITPAAEPTPRKKYLSPYDC